MIGNVNSYIDWLEQDCSNPSALEMELLQSYTETSIYSYTRN